jgi:hypothetical protein
VDRAKGTHREPTKDAKNFGVVNSEHKQASKQAGKQAIPLAKGVFGCACLGTCVVSTN